MDAEWTIEWRERDLSRIVGIVGKERTERLFGQAFALLIDGANYGHVSRHPHDERLYARNWSGMIYMQPQAELALVTTGGESYEQLQDAQDAHLAWVLAQLEPGGRLDPPAARKQLWAEPVSDAG